MLILYNQILSCFKIKNPIERMKGVEPLIPLYNLIFCVTVAYYVYVDNITGYYIL